MPKLVIEELLKAGAHFGHLTRRWNPKMKPYIFMEKNGIHILDLKKTVTMAEDAFNALENIASTGKEILFVGTKKQAKSIIREQAERASMPYVTERWLGGMLTNFSTIRQSVRRLNSIERMENDGTFDIITKKERLMLSREKEKLVKVLGGVSHMTRLPAALFLVDIRKEHIAVAEATNLGIPTFAVVDTNCDPDTVTHIIPGNDDSIRSIELIIGAAADVIIAARTANDKQQEMDVAASGKN
ncbi:MAG: 30S ribosomal protein S2 [Chloroherpetonaceae bacterium]|nr:30S ribosomal protein S2 [Chloroherpetonaceae bacterium]